MIYVARSAQQLLHLGLRCCCSVPGLSHNICNSFISPTSPTDSPHFPSLFTSEYGDGWCGVIHFQFSVVGRSSLVTTVRYSLNPDKKDISNCRKHERLSSFSYQVTVVGQEPQYHLEIYFSSILHGVPIRLSPLRFDLWLWWPDIKQFWFAHYSDEVNFDCVEGRNRGVRNQFDFGNLILSKSASSKMFSRQFWSPISRSLGTGELSSMPTQ